MAIYEFPNLGKYTAAFFAIYGLAILIFRKNYIIINDLIYDLSKTIEYKNEFEVIFQNLKESIVILSKQWDRDKSSNNS